MAKLTHTTCSNTKSIGMLGDGNGLYLKVQKSTKSTNGVTKSWLFRWGAGGQRSIGLGNFPEITLMRARELALETKRQISEGLDPTAERQKQRKAQAISQQGSTFKKAAESYIETHRASWRNQKHAQQWTNTLEQYAYPHIGNKSLSDICTDDITKLLSPIWTTKNPTATRLRGRIEQILDSATATGLRPNTLNPAAWRGNLQHLLPSFSKRKNTRHFAALPYKDTPAFYQALKQLNTIGAKALQFTILTATRTGEVIGANWNEIDFDEKIWIVPADRTKANVQHRVPLSNEAFQIVIELHKTKINDWLFPSPRGLNKHISNMAMLKLIKQLPTQHGITVHGFRSTFRDWAGEQTTHSREVLEQALSHQLQDEVEAAYSRGDSLKKRKSVMDEWANFCLS
jgi:integrase